MTSIRCFLYKSEFKKDKDEEIASNDEERDCNPTQALIAKFPPNWKLMLISHLYSTRNIPQCNVIQIVPPVQCPVTDLNGVTEKDQIKHELRKWGPV